MRGAFEDFLMFTPKIGEMIQFDEYFAAWLKPPVSCEYLEKQLLPSGQIIATKPRRESPQMLAIVREYPQNAQAIGV